MGPPSTKESLAKSSKEESLVLEGDRKVIVIVTVNYSNSNINSNSNSDSDSDSNSNSNSNSNNKVFPERDNWGQH